MEPGVVFPQTELGADPGAARAFAEAAEELGYRHLLAFDHVVGADPAVHRGWSGPYDVRSTFHEPFVLFGFLAALTSMELVTGIVVLPQRQTVLVAKQAAEVDVLTGGRFRLGVGVGWNAVEYEALGKSFADRGARLGEQVGLLRRLWTEESVTFEGRYERVTGAGIAPLPVQRPIPVWFGGHSPATYRRIGAIGDGWFPLLPPGPELDAAWAAIRRAAEEAGRDPAAIGVHGRVVFGHGDLDVLAHDTAAWHGAGADHISLSTMGSGLSGVDGHIGALARAAGVLRQN
jgi:probable F420-dependent oxidoreductase